MDHDQNQDSHLQFNRPSSSNSNGGGDSAQSRAVTLVSQHTSGQHADAPMDTSYDDMPELQPLSDSGSEYGSDMDANEVEMQTVEDTASAYVDYIPPLRFGTINPSLERHNSNRRPRVDDDGDDERDRRHPSQRVSSVTDNAASSSSAQASAAVPPMQSNIPTFTPTPNPANPQQANPRHPNVQRHIFHTTISLGPEGPANPFRLYQHLFPNNDANGPNPTNHNTINPDNTNPNPDNNDNNDAQGPPLDHAQHLNQPPNANASPQPQQPIFGGVLSFDLGPGLLFGLPAGPAMPPMNANPGGIPPTNNQPQGLPPQLADLLSRIGAQVIGGLGGVDNQEDPDRARKLVDGLEVVPEGLVRRLERVGGSGGGMGEDPSRGGDSGCAICWDRLLDSDGEGFGTSETEEGSSEAQTEKQRKIVSLPCAHVFHADCLIPWFSRPRQTTCPTCRFNIDPDNLTYVPWSVRQRERREAEAAAAGTTQGDQPAAAGSSDATSVPNPVPPSTADAPADVPTPGAVPAAHHDNPIASARDQIISQLANMYADSNPELAALLTRINRRPGNTQEQPQAQAEQSQPPPTQTGPGPAAAAVPITIPIPVAIPLAGIHTAATPGIGAQAQAQAQPPLTHRGGLGLPANIQTLNSATPDASSSTNAQLTTGPVSLEGTPDASQTPADPAQPFRLGAFGVHNSNPSVAVPPTAPPTGQRPPHIHPINLDGVDIGIPGMRADIVVTMDMFFNPVGDMGPHNPDRTRRAAEGGNAGESDADEEIPMLLDIPEEEMRQMQQQEEEHFRQMMDMFSGRGPTGNSNQNPGQPQPAEGTLPGDEQQPPVPPNPFQFIGEAGRSMGEAFVQMLAGAQRQPGQADDQAAPAHPDVHAPPEPAQQGDAPGQDGPRMPRPRMRSAFTGFAPRQLPRFPDIFGGRARRPQGPKPAWTLPSAPGPSLRQRVERREREAGLRCSDVSCGLGPSDDDPFTDEVSKSVSAMKQLVIREKDEGHAQVCEHRFHSACLVSSERVFLRGADAAVEDGRVEVSCPHISLFTDSNIYPHAFIGPSRKYLPVSRSKVLQLTLFEYMLSQFLFLDHQYRAPFYIMNTPWTIILYNYLQIGPTHPHLHPHRLQLIKLYYYSLSCTVLIPLALANLFFYVP